MIVHVKPLIYRIYDLAKYELGPPRLRDIPEARQKSLEGFKRLIGFEWSRQPLRVVLSNVFVGLDVLFWFYAGEILGKGSVIGYRIPGAYKLDSRTLGEPNFDLRMFFVGGDGFFDGVQ